MWGDLGSVCGSVSHRLAWCCLCLCCRVQFPHCGEEPGRLWATLGDLATVGGAGSHWSVGGLTHGPVRCVPSLRHVC